MIQTVVNAIIRELPPDHIEYAAEFKSLRESWVNASPESKMKWVREIEGLVDVVTDDCTHIWQKRIKVLWYG